MVLYAFIYNIRLCYKMSSLGLLKSFVKEINKKGYDGVSTGGMFGDTFYSHSLPPITLGDKPFYPVVVDKPDLGDSGFPILPPLYTESTPEPRDLT